jgi:ubiquinone/menaquinone biosynthesis C-methylase UbiE
MSLRDLIFRKTGFEPLPITMIGVRMGDRVLQVGIDDGVTAAMLAKKVGLSGVNALVAPNDRAAKQASAAANQAGVLIDVQVTGWRRFPFDSASFDVIVVHSARGLLASLTPEDRVGCLQESHRVLRPGGRIVVIEAAPREGLGRLLQRRPAHAAGTYAAHGGAAGALTAEGFRPVRALGEVEGYVFTEGLKT